MSNKKYYIYKFVDENDNVLYVGKSRNIKSRIQSHIREKQWIKKNCKVFIAETHNHADMDIYELYYINKLNPKYNIANAYNDGFSINLIDLDFKHYKTIKENEIPKKLNNSNNNNDNNISEVIKCEYRNYEELPFNNQIGYILNKDVYEKIHKYLYDLDFLKGYEFQYSDCGNESLRFTFLFNTNKEVIIRINGSCGDLFFVNDSMYYSTIKDTLTMIYNKEIIRDYVPCELNIKNNDVFIILYDEEYNWYNQYKISKGDVVISK